MSPRDFIKKGYGKDQLAKAVDQQKQLQYLTVSQIQENVTADYIEKLSEAYSGKDPMLSWVYTLFKKDNWKSFYKYCRFPLPSSSLAKDEIEKSMERVFFSDDSFVKYIVNNKEIQEPEFLDCDHFQKQVFNWLLYRHNDIIIHDNEDINTPYRKIISIEDVVSIKVKGSKIKNIAYKTSFEIDGEYVDGHIYMDDDVMAFVPVDEKKESIEIPIDIDRCPASFISASPFGIDDPVVRESIFSRVRPLMEQYNFLTTLQLMSDANGAFPIVVKLATQSEDEDDNIQGELGYASFTGENAMSSTLAQGHKKKRPASELNAGSVHEVPPIEKNDGSYDMSVVQNYINFFRTPVDSLNYIKTRIEDVRKEIIRIVVGDFTEQNDSAKNEMQVSKSYIAKQDRLRAFGYDMAWCMSQSDDIMLRLAYGTNVYTSRSFGTDFFIETQSDLFNLFSSAPNPIEKNFVLNRLVRSRGQNNTDRMERDLLLYKIIPFSDNKDFIYSVGLNVVSTADILFQTKFQYFISIFESNYGDIVEFYYNLNGEIDAAKITVIKNLIYNIIKDYEQTSNPASSLQEV
ncbi:hypothetical protein EP331_00445 [bacterium]|nr:MAG: hypothetical protein EP331_00445 [bacterium]